MNRHSLIFWMGLFFLLLFGLINLLLIVENRYRLFHEHSVLMERFSHATHQMHPSGRFSDEQLDALLLEYAKVPLSILREQGDVLIEQPFRTLVSYEGSTYFIGCRPPKPPFGERFGPMETEPPFATESCLVLKSLQDTSEFPFYMILAAANLILLLFFLFFVKKLQPLRDLKLAVERLGSGEGTQKRLEVRGKDEIADIAQSYNAALEKIATLREARQLFLRNILHEFKTPIMKGRLMCDFVPDDARRSSMERLFERMEFLLLEFSNIEKFTSGEWPLKLQRYRFVDILDHACDLAVCTHDAIVLEMLCDEPHVTADFEYFSIALKNIIDNALKYSQTPPLVQVRENSLSVCSSGEALHNYLKNMDRIFNRPYESGSGSLGLGLYIANAIVTRHGYRLDYTHNEGMNCFTISWNKPTEPLHVK